MTFVNIIPVKKMLCKSNYSFFAVQMAEKCCKHLSEMLDFSVLIRDTDGKKLGFDMNVKSFNMHCTPFDTHIIYIYIGIFLPGEYASFR